MYLLRFILPLMAWLTASAVSAAEYGPLGVVDPVSSTEIRLPEAQLCDSSTTKFLKFSAATPGSMVYIYSMENPESCPYTWERINRFEDDYKPGRYLRQHRLPEGTEGWTRFYESTASDGTPLIKALTLVRGNAYALYIYEIARDSSQLVTPEVAATTDFRDITGKRIDNDGVMSWRTWTFLGAFLVMAAIIKLVWRRPGTAAISSIILASVAIIFVILYFVGRFNIFASGIFAVTVGAIFYPILSAESWDDFFDKLSRILKQ